MKSGFSFFAFCIFVPQKMTSVAESSTSSVDSATLVIFWGTNRQKAKKREARFLFQDAFVELSASRRFSRLKNSNNTTTLSTVRFFAPKHPSARTTGYLLGISVTLFLSTVLQALHRLMSGVENLSVPGLRATSQNISWSTTKVNEACAAPTRHMTKVRTSIDSPH